MNNFLVLGTGADINNIDFSQINHKWITAGVNRIHEKIIPDYFFCYDAKEVVPNLPDTIKTIYTHPGKLAEYFRGSFDIKKNYCSYYDEDYTPGFRLHGKRFDCGHGSISYLIRTFNNYLYKGQENIFYLAGVPLLEDIGHFYDDSNDEATTQISLDRFFNDFLRLVDQGFAMVSLMKESRLNDILPVKDLEIIYNPPIFYNHNGDFKKKIKEYIDAIS